MNECEEREPECNGNHDVQHGECIYCHIVIEDDPRDYEDYGDE